MVEQNAQGELGGAWVAFQVGVRSEIAERLAEVLLNRRVKIERATLDEAHDHGCKSRLCERCGGHYGVGREWEILFRVAQAVSLEVENLAVTEDRDASAGDVRGLDQTVHGRIDLRRRKLASVRASDCGLRGS